MYHSITFADLGNSDIYTAEEANNLGRPDLAGMIKGYNTWYDWHMIPTSRPTIEHPEITMTFTKIPGRHGSIDFTNYMSDNPIMADRSGSFEFVMVEGYGDRLYTRLSLVNTLHGRRMKMSFTLKRKAKLKMNIII